MADGRHPRLMAHAPRSIDLNPRLSGRDSDSPWARFALIDGDSWRGVLGMAGGWASEAIPV
ncbi:hypothetical protein AMJ39_04750 [candidate division TA06 bacterium DG_24]|uniref:Uncharacterized protein n=2 Tax=Bacteria division TA06 TaxID=1156500 RepID=A0A0S8GFQ4_UNCT6|nr:MAG: hypothetical protein AMJ39_04750 [candidate division TA06 bacterium DG_24]KPK71536.1 MAG: hypothetical protein AMJ82_00830 [candidate division TA06 bacterium SM23_40]